MNRIQELLPSGSGLHPFSVQPHSGQLPRRNSMNQIALHPRLSISQMTTYRWSLEDDVHERRRAGIDCIGLWRPKLVECGEEKAIDLILESGLEVSSLSWAGGFTGSHGFTFNQAVQDGLEALELASRLGAECLVVVGGTTAGHITKHARRLVVDGLNELADAASEYDVKLALQPMHQQFEREWTFVTSLDDAIHIAEECANSHVGLSLNSFHMREESNLIPRLDAIVSLLHHVQICDGRHDQHSEFDRFLPGDGDIPLAEFVLALKDAGYHGAYEIDVWSDSLWQNTDSKLLENCRERFSRLWTDFS